MNKLVFWANVIQAQCLIIYFLLSHDVMSENNIMPFNKIDKALVAYRFSTILYEIHYNVA